MVDITTESSTQAAPWLLLIHSIPPKPDYFRVKVRRRLEKLGAAALKNSVYVLPNNDESLEDFQWLAQEIAAEGGEAMLCEAEFVAEFRIAKSSRNYERQERQERHDRQGKQGVR